MRIKSSFVSGCLIALCLTMTLYGRQEPSPVTISKDGKLEYVVDSRGNRVPDFSGAGYGGGGIPWQTIPARVQVNRRCVADARAV
jgi:hypothetical protein